MTDADKESTVDEPDPARAADIVPRHIAIIMDGNGRWAKARGRARLYGHEQGAESVRIITEACVQRNIGELTLYAFSTENWRRPKHEVNGLMRLLRRFLAGERDTIMKNGIRFRAIGRLEALSPALQRDLARTTRMSADNPGLILRLALNYGGRAELVDATRAVAAAVARGELKPEEIDEKVIRRHLYDPDMADPDLLIRTAGEMRLSNFLPWQLTYAEFHFTQLCWPDFREEALDEALRAYAARRRRFGGLSPAGSGDSSRTRATGS